MDAIVVETARLYLRPFREEDTDALFRVLGDPENMRWTPEALTWEGCAAWIEWCESSYETNGFGLWAVVDKATGELLGDCGPSPAIVDGANEVEMGWHIHRRVHNLGIATEAARACRDYAFSELGIPRLVALVRPPNYPSRRVAEKIGMVVEKMVPWGPRGHDHLVYATRRD